MRSGLLDSDDEDDPEGNGETSTPKLESATVIADGIPLPAECLPGSDQGQLSGNMADGAAVCVPSADHDYGVVSPPLGQVATARLKLIIGRLLYEDELESEWGPTILKMALCAVTSVATRTEAGFLHGNPDSIDYLRYIPIKCIRGGNIADTMYVDGVVDGPGWATIAHKRMETVCI